MCLGLFCSSPTTRPLDSPHRTLTPSQPPPPPPKPHPSPPPPPPPPQKAMSEHVIDYTPHYEVLVKEGATHFDSISAAIFEHIDNSITAFKVLPPEHERKIEVQIHMPAQGLYDKNPIYLAICDNAGGMTTKQLEAYFTAALGRETRGLDPKGGGKLSEAAARMAHLAGNLSKFGVGALQSFAYLGTQLKVITKDREEGKVRWYKIDKDYFRAKEEQHGRDSVFKGTVHVVPSAVDALESGERRTHLVNHLAGLDAQPHFTVVLIRMQDIHKRELFETQGAKILYDLADVFYYYIKPKDFPVFPERASKRPSTIALGKGSADAALADKRAKTRSGQNVGSAAPSGGGGGIWPAEEGGEEEESGPIEMSVAYFKENSTRETRTVLTEEVLKECLEGKYWEEAAKEDTFAATFQVDDPRFVPLEDHAALQLAQKVEVSMLARYYPFANYEESRPKYAQRYNMDTEDEDARGGVVEPVVDVRWMARKLPKAMYQRLYFFPAERRTAANKAELELCGTQWRERVHITLFIKDWYFAVSNNKLNVQGDFGELLKDPRRCISVEPRDLPTRFVEWLQRCHKNYDRENALEVPFPAGQRPAGASNRQGVLYFQRVRFATGDEGTWRRDEIVKICTGGGGASAAGGGRRGSRGGGASSSSGGNLGETAAPLKDYLARISHFEVEETDDLNMATSTRVYYTRLPEDIFGADNMAWEHVVGLDPAKCKLKPEQAASMEKEVRHRLARKADIFFWDGGDKSSKDKLPKSVDWVEGDVDQARRFEHLLVMVRDNRGLALSETSSVVRGMYSVELRVKQRDTDSMVDEACATEAKTMDVDGPCYAFRLPPTLESGRYTLSFSVLGPGPARERIVTTTYNVTVNEEPAGEPVAVDVDGLRPNSKGSLVTFAEEMPLSAFSVLLKDHRGRPTTAPSVTLALAMEKEHFKVEYRGKKGKRVDGAAVDAGGGATRGIKRRGRPASRTASPAVSAGGVGNNGAVCFSMTADMAEDGIAFEAGEWVLVPDFGQGPLLSADEPESIKEGCIITVLSAGDKLQNEVLERELVIEPGQAVSLELVEPEPTDPATPIEVPNETQAVPTLRFKALDVGGNMTAPPRSQRWGVELSAREGGVRLIEPSSRRNDSGWKVSPLGEVVIDGLSLDVTFEKEHKGKRVVTLDVSGSTGDGGEVFTTTAPVTLAVSAQRDVPKRAWLELRGEGILDDGCLVRGAEENSDDEEEGEIDSELNLVKLKPGRKMKVLLPAGGTLPAPTVVVVDEVGEVLDPAKIGLKLKATATSWTQTEETADHAVLPDLPGPKDKVVKLQVQVFHAHTRNTHGRAVLPAYILEAEIHPIPGKADHFSFNRELANSFRCGVPADRQNATVHYRDKFKNYLSVGPEDGLPCPTIQWVSQDKGDPLEQDPEGALQTVLGEDGAYHLPTAVTLRGRARQIKLRVTAPKFTAMKSTVMLLPGPVHTMKLAAPQHDLEEFTEKPTVSLCRGEKMESLQVAFYDECGNLVDPPLNSSVNLFWNDRTSSRPSAASSRGSLTAGGASGGELVSKVVVGKELLTADLEKFVDPQPLALGSFVFNEKRERVLRVELHAPGGGNQPAVLCSGELTVKTYQVNRVIGMKLVVGTSECLDLDPEKYPAGAHVFTPLDDWDVDSKVPALGIFLETEDKEEPELNLAAAGGVVRVRVDREGTTRVHNEDWFKGVEAKLGVLASDTKRRMLVLPPSDTDAILGDPGNYQLRVTYVEAREHIKKVTPNKKDWQVDRNLVVQVKHGRAKAVKPDGMLASLSLSASNNRDDPRARQILREARLYPVDDNDKRTRHDSSLIVTVVSGRVLPTVVPEGEGPSIVRGRVTVEPRQDTRTGLTTYVVPEISLEKDVGSKSGVYKLKFESPGLAPWFKEFTFTTDLERQNKVRVLNQELNPLRQRLNAWKDQVQRLEASVNGCVRTIHKELEYLQKQAGIFTQLQLQRGQLPTQQELRDTRAALEQSLVTLRNQEVFRCQKKPGYPSQAVKSQGFKEVVQVGMVQDRRMAEMLSWYATTKNMKAVICPTNADYKRIQALQPDVPVYTLQDVEEFRASRDKTREQIIADRRLPLPPVDARFNYRGHAVNQIILRPEDEHLRQSVFYSIFSNTIILDTEDDALAYREHCKQRNLRRCTVMCYKDGRRLRSGGPLDALDRFKDARGLEFIFGGQDPKETPEFQAKLKAKEKVEGLFLVYNDLEQAKAELEASKEDAEMQKQEARAVEMERQLQSVMGNRSG